MSRSVDTLLGMHAFLDDSGCGGVKFDAGSSAHLVMAIVTFEQPDHIEAAARAIRALREVHRLREGEEYKFSKSGEGRRSDFFEAVDPFDYHVRAIVIDKRKLWAEWRVQAETVKFFAMRQLLTHTGGHLRHAKLVVDGTDRRELGKPTSERLLSTVNDQVPGTLRAVEFADSKRNVMLQLADMAAGAVHRSVRPDDKRSVANLMQLRTKIVQPQGSLWHFR